MNDKNPEKPDQNTDPLKRELPGGVKSWQCGFVIPPSLPEDEIIELIRHLGHINRNQTWALADVARHALDRGFERAAEMLSATTKKAPNYLRNIAAVARAFPNPEDRHPGLDFAHHMAVYENEPNRTEPDLWNQRRKEWLEKAEKENWSGRDLETAMAGSRLRERNQRDFGIHIHTKPGIQLAKQISGILFKPTLNLAEMHYGRNVITDIEHLLESLKQRLEAEMLPKASTEATPLTEREKALRAALDQYLQSDRRDRDFASACVNHNVKVRELGEYRLAQAAALHLAGKSYAEIERALNVKDWKLKRYFKKTKALNTESLQCADSQTDEQVAPVPWVASAVPALPTQAAEPLDNTGDQPTESNGVSSSKTVEPAKLEAALKTIEQGTHLFKAARAHGVEIPDLIEYRHAACAQLFLATKSVPVTAARYRIDRKNLKHYLRQCGLLSQEPATNGGEPAK